MANVIWRSDILYVTLKLEDALRLLWRYVMLEK